MAPLPSTILVAHDFTKRADRAVRRARMLTQSEGRIIVFHATEKFGRRETLRTHLIGRLQSMLEPDELIRVAAEVHDGSPHDVAANLMRSHAADLLIVGLHGKKGLAELLATNTMARMVSTLARPTLVATTSPPKPYRNVLVGIDFAEIASSALALARGWFPKAEITALHAFDLQLGRRATGPVKLNDLDDARKQWLADVVRRTGAAHTMGHVRTLLLHGAPADTLRQTARDLAYDLIVIGCHHRGRLRDAIFGSVGRSLLADPPCDVLVVPPAADI